MVRSSTVSFKDVETFICERKNIIDTKDLQAYRIEPILVEKDTVMYLVNYDDGWEVISGDMRTEPILFFCDHGNISKEELFANPASESVFEGLSLYLDSLRVNPVKMNNEQPTKGNPVPPSSFFDENGRYWALAYKYLARSSEDLQNPLSGLRWGQGTLTGPPYMNWNATMPYRSPLHGNRCVAGCGPVAVAQTLVYLHQKNSSPSEFYSNATCTGFLPDTTSILVLNAYNTSFSGYGDYWSSLPVKAIGTSASKFKIASSLLLHIGLLSNSEYGYNNTTSSLSNLQFALQSYGYNSTLSSSYSNIFRTQIFQNKMPVILRISGQRVEGSTVSELKHFVVAEGYKKRNEVYTFVYKNGDTGTFEYRYKQYTFSYEYLAINWGYDGSGEYNSTNDVIWCNVNSSLHRDFSGGYDNGTITHMLYNFVER